jgi:hypothetical protein
MIWPQAIRWDLLVPLVLAIAVAVGQTALTRREMRTGEVAWWAKLRLPLQIHLDYSDPANFRARQIGNVLMSGVIAVIAAFLLIKFLGF